MVLRENNVNTLEIILSFGNTCPGLLADTSRDLGYLGAVAPSVIGIRIYIREVSQLPSFIVTSVIKLGHCP